MYNEQVQRRTQARHINIVIVHNKNEILNFFLCLHDDDYDANELNPDLKHHPNLCHILLLITFCC
jgi:hypothetical protein